MQIYDMVPQPTSPVTIPFRITLLVKFFKDGLSIQGRPPHPPRCGPPSPLEKAKHTHKLQFDVLHLFFNMLNTHIDYCFDVLVVERVEHRFSDLSVFDKPCIFEHAELVRDRRHTHRELFGDVANAHLTLKEKV